MASEVEIANLALSNLGDRATVASLDPPEGSAQAEHCARFYPIARDMLLEMHAWGFATRHATLALLVDTPLHWLYTYVLPADCIRVQAVLPPESTDDKGVDFALGLNALGQRVLYSNTEGAVVRYTARVIDTTLFSPMFTMALSWKLSALLAGAILKGDAGAAQARTCEQMMAAYLGQARVSDANQRQVPKSHTPAWIGGR